MHVEIGSSVFKWFSLGSSLVALQRAQLPMPPALREQKTRQNYDRASMNISSGDLKEILKTTVKSLDGKNYGSGSHEYIAETFFSFFELLFKKNCQRLNKMAMAKVGADLFQLKARDADIFGTALQKTFCHLRNGRKNVVSGGKTTATVYKLYQAMDEGSNLPALADLATEPQVFAIADQQPPRRQSSMLALMDKPWQGNGDENQPDFMNPEKVKAMFGKTPGMPKD